jgi:Leucine-rich repeat (LRR) protein
MKRLSPITALMVLAYSITTVSCQNGQGSANPPVFWDGGTIPDPVFRAYVLGRFDTDRNGKISREEADAVFAIDVDAETADTPLIESLTGVEYFKNLGKLTCNWNNLAALDLSENTALDTLDCSWNRIKALDLAGNKALAKLDCSQNQLTKLDLTKNTELNVLYCTCNRLAALDLSKNKALTELYCNINELATLDLFENTELKVLDCSKNKLIRLDLSENRALAKLDCSRNSLAKLDLSENTALHFLSAWQNPLLLLDISGLSKIRHMDFDFEDNDIQVITDHRTAIDDDLLRYYAIRRSRKAEKE